MVNDVDLCEYEWSTVLLGNLQQAAKRQENTSKNLRQYRRGVQVEFGKSSAAQSGERREITTRRRNVSRTEMLREFVVCQLSFLAVRM